MKGGEEQQRRKNDNEERAEMKNSKNSGKEKK